MSVVVLLALLAFFGAPFATGVGAQRDANSDWRRSDFLNLRVRSPRNDDNWQMHADVTYTSQPGDSAISGGDYGYFKPVSASCDAFSRGFGVKGQEGV